MKAIYKLLLIVIALPIVLLVLANNSGSPGGYSGSVGDNNETCTACHSGTAITQTNWITTTIPAEGYTPLQTYQITVTGTHAGAAKIGFELTAENSSNQKVGTFTITNATRTKLINQNKSVTHTSSGVSPTTGTNTWSVNWTAPSTNVGQIRFYTAVNAANGNSTTSGDVIYKSSQFVNAFVPATLASIVPNSAIQGETKIVTITGQNTLWAGTVPVVKLIHNGATVTEIIGQNITVASNTSLTARFEIPTTAPIGQYLLQVGSINLSNAFTVTLLSNIATVYAPNVSIYPNPATETLYVETDKASRIRILDLSGRTLHELVALDSKTGISLKQMKAGTYIVEVVSENTRNIQKFVVK